jgi:hypothetical protein
MTDEQKLAHEALYSELHTPSVPGVVHGLEVPFGLSVIVA